jgi:membrane protease YdiL (CAAX protease family)
MEWIVLVIAIAALVTTFMYIRSDSKAPPWIRRIAYLILLAFAVYLGIAVVAAFILPLDALAASTLGLLALALVAYLVLGAVWVLRLTPSRQSPAAFFRKSWTSIDTVLVAAFVIGVVGTVYGLPSS